MEFGDFCKVTGYLIRVRNGFERSWEKHFYSEPKEATFLGKRTLWNGRWETDSDDEGYYFSQIKPLKGACICIRGRKPQNVLLEQVIELKELE